MPTLERRVQVLFDPEEYEELVAYARDERRSVGSVIRESVRSTIASPATSRQEALARLFASADANPVPVGDWEEVKESFERESLMAIQ